MSRISEAFATSRKGKRAAFIPYITAGDPDISRTVDLAKALRRGGADVLELGVPFSDPIADGPTNQRAAERALASGTRLHDVLDAVREIRLEEELPIVLFTYSNPVAAPSSPPSASGLAQLTCRPNPATDGTVLRFSMESAGPATLAIFSIDGRRVATLLDGPMGAGRHQIDWAGRDDLGREVQPGVYFVRLLHDGLVATAKVLVLER